MRIGRPGHPPPDVSAVADSPRPADGPQARADLAQTYRDHVRMVWRVAAAFGIPPGDREDFVHDVFVVAHRRAGDRLPEVAMTTWLFGIAKHVRWNHTRAKARHDRKLRVVEAPLAEGDRPDELAARAESLTAVREFVAGLEEGPRVAFELVEVRGMTAGEVAELTGDNVNTIYTRLRTARRLFRDFVATHLER
jgi:RNA polymerase sigma factor (sigma-70 family)